VGFSKECRNCGKISWWYKFHFQKTGKFGLNANCIICKRILNNKWADKNREKLRSYSRKRYSKNLEESRKKVREYRKKNIEHFRKMSREYRRKNNEHCKMIDKKWREKNKDKRAESSRKYSQNNKHKALIYERKNRKRMYGRKKEWANNNPDRMKVYQKRRHMKAVGGLSDSYIKMMLSKQTGIQYRDIPQGIIELKRLQLKMFRGIRKAKGELENGFNTNECRVD